MNVKVLIEEIIEGRRLASSEAAGIVARVTAAFNAVPQHGLNELSARVLLASLVEADARSKSASHKVVPDIGALATLAAKKFAEQMTAHLAKDPDLKGKQKRDILADPMKRLEFYREFQSLSDAELIALGDSYGYTHTAPPPPPVKKEEPWYRDDAKLAERIKFDHGKDWGSMLVSDRERFRAAYADQDEAPRLERDKTTLAALKARPNPSASDRVTIFRIEQELAAATQPAA